MDPRHPELAVKRIGSLMRQYKKIIKTMEEEATSVELSKLEREGSLVVQEICLVAPRLHEAMMQSSRQRRHDISHGKASKPTEEKAKATSKKKTTKKTAKKKAKK